MKTSIPNDSILQDVVDVATGRKIAIAPTSAVPVPLSVSYKEAATILSRSVQSVKNYVRDGRLEAYRLPNQRRAVGVLYSSIVRALEKGGVE